MTYLQESASAQEVKFIARSLQTGAATVVFTDELLNTAITDSVTLSTDRYYTLFSQAIPELKEEHSYMMVVTHNSVDIFKGKVFVTNQTPLDYSINDGMYTERSTTNDFIII